MCCKRKTKSKRWSRKRNAISFFSAHRLRTQPRQSLQGAHSSGLSIALLDFIGFSTPLPVLLTRRLCSLFPIKRKAMIKIVFKHLTWNRLPLTFVNEHLHEQCFPRWISTLLPSLHLRIVSVRFREVPWHSVRRHRFAQVADGSGAETWLCRRFSRCLLLLQKLQKFLQLLLRLADLFELKDKETEKNYLNFKETRKKHSVYPGVVYLPTYLEYRALPSLPFLGFPIPGIIKERNT